MCTCVESSSRGSHPHIFRDKLGLNVSPRDVVTIKLFKTPLSYHLTELGLISINILLISYGRIIKMSGSLLGTPDTKEDYYEIVKSYLLSRPA